MRANVYAHGIDGVTASRKASAALYGMVQQHASMLAFLEAFWVMGMVFLLMLHFLRLLQYSKLVVGIVSGSTTMLDLPGLNLYAGFAVTRVTAARERHLD
ncbi:MAG TPA: hypothetical protein VGK96_04845 [Candidatus Sulfotelmatobacter sp.]